MPSRRKVVKKSAPKVSRKSPKKTARKVVKKSARKTKVVKSARKSVKKVVKKSSPKSVKKTVRKNKSIKKTVPIDSSANETYPVCFLFGVHFVDDEETGRVNVNALSKKAKALFSEAIIKECKNGFHVSDFYVKNISITFQNDDKIRVEGTVDIDPESESFGANLEDWIHATNEKSIWQTAYGPNTSEYDVESNGRKYALASVKMC
jgi:hypothetical protein